MIKLTIDAKEDGLVVFDPTKSGSPPVGRGKTIIEAIGSFFHNNQTNLGIEFKVTEAAVPFKMKRRQEELSER